MAEGDPAQLLERHHGRDRGRHRGEHLARPGVEQEWLVGIHEELVEREPGRPDVGHERREAEDAIGDLVDSSVHEFAPQSGRGWASTPWPGKRPDSVRMKSTASISTRSPSTPAPSTPAP